MRASGGSGTTRTMSFMRVMQLATRTDHSHHGHHASDTAPKRSPITNMPGSPGERTANATLVCTPMHDKHDGLKIIVYVMQNLFVAYLLRRTHRPEPLIRHGRGWEGTWEVDQGKGWKESAHLDLHHDLQNGEYLHRRVRDHHTHHRRQQFRHGKGCKGGWESTQWDLLEESAHLGLRHDLPNGEYPHQYLRRDR